MGKTSVIIRILAGPSVPISAHPFDYFHWTMIRQIGQDLCGLKIPTASAEASVQVYFDGFSAPITCALANQIDARSTGSGGKASTPLRIVSDRPSWQRDNRKTPPEA
ncbi:MAG TPA: hypothetical protein VIX14_07865 [Terriglobales bacterium]